MGKAKSKETREELRERRLSLAVDLLSSLHSKGEVVAQLKQEFQISARACERIITPAKARILANTEKELSEHINEAYGFYRRMIKDSTIDVRERIRAREALDKLLGIQGKTLKAAAGISKEQINEIISNVVLDVLHFLAALNPKLREFIADKQTELADFIDKKYGTGETENYKQ